MKKVKEEEIKEIVKLLEKQYLILNAIILFFEDIGLMLEYEGIYENMIKAKNNNKTIQEKINKFENFQF